MGIWCSKISSERKKTNALENLTEKIDLSNNKYDSDSADEINSTTRSNTDSYSGYQTDNSSHKYSSSNSEYELDSVKTRPSKAYLDTINTYSKKEIDSGYEADNDVRPSKAEFEVMEKRRFAKKAKMHSNEVQDIEQELLNRFKISNSNSSGSISR